MQINRLSQSNANFSGNKNNNLTFGATPILNGIAEDLLITKFQLNPTKKNLSEKIVNFMGKIIQKIRGITENTVNNEPPLSSKCKDLTQVESEKIVNFLGKIVKSVNESKKTGNIHIYVESNAVIYPKKQDFAITMERPHKTPGSKNSFENTLMSFQEILKTPEQVLENAKKWINS